MSKKYWVVIVCLISIAGVMQGCGVGLLATLGAASSGSSGGNKDSGPSAPPSAFWLSNPKEVTATSLRLDWTASANATNYTIYRKIGADGNWGEIITTDASTVTLIHTNLTPGTTYYYYVKATNSLGLYVSNEVNATTINIQPDSLIKKGTEGDDEYLTNNLYNSDGLTQTKKAFTSNGVIASYYVKIENDGGTTDNFTITASPSTGWNVRYWAGPTEITSQVNSTGWVATGVVVGGNVIIRINVLPETIPTGNGLVLYITATSQTASMKQDTVQAVTEVVDKSITTTWGGGAAEYVNYHGIAIDPNGNTYLCGATQSYEINGDAVFIKYNKDGIAERIKTWGGANGDSANDIAAGANNKIYVCGQTYTGTTDDAFVLCYDTSTDIIDWATALSGTNYETATGIVLDSMNNIYVCGQTDTLGSNDVFLVKLDSAGNVITRASWGNTGFNDGATAIAVHNDDVYICGNTDISGTGDVLLLKYGKNLNKFVWAYTWGGPNLDEARDIAIDSNNNIYLCGQTSSFGAGDNDAFILKIDNTGSLVWQKTWGGPNLDSANGITVDPANDVYVCGDTNSFPTLGQPDGFILKYNIDAVLDSQKICDSTTNPVWLRDIKVNYDNIHLSGGAQYNDSWTFSVVNGTTSGAAGIYQSVKASSQDPLFFQLNPGFTAVSQPTGGGGQDLLFLRRSLRE